MKKYLPVPVAALVALVVAGAISTASIPDASNVIHGCYQPLAKGQAGGNLAVIDSASQECPEGATALNWNKGPAVVGYGNTQGNGGSYKEGTTYFTNEPIVITPTQKAICSVTLDGAVLRNSGSGAKVTYGVAVKKDEGSFEFTGSYLLTTTQGSFSGTNDAASLAKTTLVSVEAGHSYSFSWGLTAPASSTGTAYPNENVICFAD